MKKSVFYSMAISLFVIACTKDDPITTTQEDNYLPLDNVSLKYMPYEGHPSLVFVNERNEETKLTALEGLQVDTVWNYNKTGTPGIIYNEFRRLRLTGYRPDSLYLQILVDMSVDQTETTPFRFFDLLSVSFSDGIKVGRSTFNYPVDFKLITSTRGSNATLKDAWLSQEPQYFPEITLSGRNFTEVYLERSDDGLEMYCAKGMGVVAFKDMKHLWVLDRLE